VNDELRPRPPLHRPPGAVIHEEPAMLATQHATSVLTLNRLAAVVLGLCLSACAAVVLAKSATAEAQEPAATSSSAKTAGLEEFVAVFTGMYENGVPIYRGFPPLTVIASRKVELAKIAREQKLARETQIRAQVASKHREQESVKATSAPHAPRNGSRADGAA
jgi:hypothetical protein